MMKFLQLYYLTLGLLVSTPTLACLQNQGDVDLNWRTGDVYPVITVVDNGLLVCGAINAGEFRIDQDDHISLNCLPGYIYAVTKDGSMSWYRNKDGGTFSWKNDNHPLLQGDHFYSQWSTNLYGC
jgi:hypothetical protein